MHIIGLYVYHMYNNPLCNGRNPFLRHLREMIKCVESYLTIKETKEQGNEKALQKS